MPAGRGRIRRGSARSRLLASLAAAALTSWGLALPAQDAVLVSDWDDTGVVSAGAASESPFRILPPASPEVPSEYLRMVQVGPRQPFEIVSPYGDAGQPGTEGYGTSLLNPSFGSPLEQIGAFDPLTMPLPSVERVLAGDQLVVAAADPGELLQIADSVQTVDTQRRSPVAFDPHVRGYMANQIVTTADGSYWLPVRQDLDSMLSKFDPSLIQSIDVIAGPYSVRNGPGFAFLDVTTTPTPRYCNGYETHARTGLSYRTNGEQWYGRETIQGGSADYGFIVAYGNRTGNDYNPGENAPVSFVPSSYHNQNFLGQFGWDLSDTANVEFRYQRLDQSDTEYPLQFFDVRALVTDGFNLTYANTAPVVGDRFEVTGWYNRTRFVGDTENVGKRNFHVIDRVEAALGTGTGSFQGLTDGDLASTGARTVTSFGDAEFAQLSVGADFRYIQQNIQERFDITGIVPPIQTNLPTAEMIDPGVFVDMKVPVTPYWTTTLGGRVDWAYTDANAAEIRANTSLPFGANGLSQNDMLYAAFLTNEIDLSQNWTAKFGFGHAERTPSLLQRYADGVFLGLIQSGFSRVIGDPTLRKERDWQIDASLSCEYEIYRARLNYFHAWIDDYVTYAANVIADPSGARLLRTINTDYATLSGFEAYHELDVTNLLTVFASLKYVEGRDHGIEQPLPQIAPFETKLGLRIAEPGPQSTWGTEWGLRLVNQQDRLAALRRVGLPGVEPLETRTPGFSTVYFRSYYNFSNGLTFVGGVDNLFDKTYFEHLDLRLPDQGPFTNSVVYSPGITPYIGLEWNL